MRLKAYLCGDAQDQQPDTYLALNEAIEKGNLAAVMALLGNREDENDRKLYSLVLHSALQGHFDWEEYDGPIFEGARGRDYWSIIKALIAHGADKNVRDKLGRTPLHYAAMKGRMEVARLLIGSKDFKEREDTWDGIMSAALTRIAKPAKVNAKDPKGITPLHVAAINAHKDVAELLIANGADVNAKTESGRTPLMFAEDIGHSDMVALLKKHGAK